MERWQCDCVHEQYLVILYSLIKTGKNYSLQQGEASGNFSLSSPTHYCRADLPLALQASLAPLSHSKRSQYFSLPLPPNLYSTGVTSEEQGKFPTAHHHPAYSASPCNPRQQWTQNIVTTGRLSEIRTRKHKPCPKTMRWICLHAPCLQFWNSVSPYQSETWICSYQQ